MYSIELHRVYVLASCLGISVVLLYREAVLPYA